MKNNKNNIISSIKELNEYCINEGFKGYSLYDSHNSPIPFGRMGKNLSFYINQVIKRFPVNIRPLIGVKKGFNPKGIGLFLHAYTNIKRYSLLEIDNIDSSIEFFFNWLKNNYSQGYKGYGWGYNFDWPKKDVSMVPAFTPSSIVTGFVARGILNYYEVFRDPTAANLISGAKDFIINEIPMTKTNKGICFSYFPSKRDITINANLLAAEILAYSDYVTNKKDHINQIEGVLEFTLNHQNNDGSWYYSFSPQTNKPKKQIDFHQGYILESIFRICKYCSIDNKKYEKYIKKGLEFYYNYQFDKRGYCYWRYPAKWPVDIHNQSQGIITFSILKDIDKKYFPFANIIAKWTIKNMQNNNGFFYYQKWPLLKNKISYMRWNQAWMLLALTTLISKMKENF